MDAIHSYDSGRDAIQITSNKPRSLQAENDFSRHLWVGTKCIYLKHLLKLKVLRDQV